MSQCQKVLQELGRTGGMTYLSSRLTLYPATTWLEGRKSGVYNYTASVMLQTVHMLGLSIYMHLIQIQLSRLLYSSPRPRSLQSLVLRLRERNSTELSC